MQEQIEKALADFWDETAIPVADAPTSSPEYVAPMDSMSAVEVLIVIDEIVGRTVKADAVIRKGGYDSRSHFVEDLTKRVLEHIAKEPT
jgi:hypothetical protein